MIPASNNLLLASADEGYNLTRSLRFRASATAWLGRTPASSTNQTTWTFSAWVKRGTLTTDYPTLFSAAQDGNNFTAITFYDTSTSYINFVYVVGGVDTVRISTTQVFRDPSAWYHIVAVADTTNATASNRMRLYVNGSQVTAFSYASYPAQNTNLWVNSANFHGIGITRAVGRYYDGQIAEVNFIDGQALTPSSFGETDTTTGVWKPKRYAGTYGTNGFYLPFTDNSALTTASNVGLGKDFSGNGNYWVTNNISITAGITYDSMTDVPTLTSATAANFAVLNPLDKGANNTLSNGNLQFQITGGTQGSVRGTFALPSTGKWYWEVTMTALGPLLTGIATSAASLTNYIGSDAFGWGYNSGDGLVYNNGTTIRANATLASGDIVGVAFDSGAGSLSFYKNNVFQTTAITGFTPATVNYFMAAGVTGGAGIANFGQRPFAYTPPTGFVALNTYNLPTSTILKGNTVFDATLYTGNGSTQTITNASAFKPDLVWIKSRSAATDNELTDSVRGVTKSLTSNSTAAEATDVQGLTAFNSNGFTVGTNTTYNNLSSTYVAWQWQAGQGTTSSNTNGTITSQVSVNASAGFSVVTYTGTGANATVGHGLGVAPSLIIIKQRSAGATYWATYHVSVGNTSVIYLNDTGAAFASSVYWNNTSPTSSVFTIGTSSYQNTSAATYVAYCWTPIAGYSAFGSISANGAADNAFVYTGFLPRFVLFKRTDSTSNWYIWDTARNTFNVLGNELYPNLANAEASAVDLDILSNGFKLRSASFSGTWVYAAFAENPFKNSLAR